MDGDGRDGNYDDGEDESDVDDDDDDDFAEGSGFIEQGMDLTASCTFVSEEMQGSKEQ